MERAATLSTRRRRRGSKGSMVTNNGSPQTTDHDTKMEASRPITTAFRPHKTLLVTLTENTPTWYECGRNTPGRDDTIFSISSPNKGSHQQSAAVINKYRSLANQIYEQEVSLSRHKTGSTTDEQWLEGAIQKGTLKDRIAAMSVLVSSDPVHKLYALDKLLQLAGVTSNTTPSLAGETSVEAEGSKMTSSGHFNVRINQMAAEALVDIFMNTLIPKNRKLYSLDKRPLHMYEPDNTTIHPMNSPTRSLSSRVLLLWRYEEMIKVKYNAFLVQYLGRALSQNAVASLERHKILILGTASNLLAEIPEGENILLAMIVNKLGDPSRKIAAAAGHRLRLVLEAHPNMTTIMAREVQQLAYRPHLSSRALYNCIIFLNQLKLTHEDLVNTQDKNPLPSSLINTYFQLFEVAVKKSNSSSTTTTSTTKTKTKTAASTTAAMKSRLLSALLTGVNRTRPFLSKTNTVMEEHVEALYRIVHTSPPAAATQALMLLFHLNIGSSSDQSTSSKSTTHTTETNKQDRFYRALYAKLSDHSMFAGRQVTLFFNLLYKSMKNDSDPVRIVAFAKRLLHTATQNNAAVCSGSLFLLSEVGRYQPCIHESMTMCRNNFAFDCTKREPRGAFHPVESSDVATVSLTEVPLSKSSLNGTLALDKTSSLWELSLCLSHYHPTVVKFANSMSDIKYDGDPLRDVTLAHFLDKFSFRNPKSVDKIAKNLKRGESIGEKRSGIEGRLTSLSSFPVNSPEFWSQNGLEDVSGSDDFFKKFFTERSKRDELKGIIRGKKDDDDGDDALDIAEGREVDFDGDDTDSEEEAFVQRLAQQLMDTSGNKRAHYDEEDPDMNDWDDLNDGEYADEDKIHNEVEDEEVDDESSVEGGNDGSIASVNSESDGSFHTDKLVNSLNSRVMKGKVSVFAAAEDYDEMISKSISRGKRSFVDGQALKELSRKKRY